MLCNQSPQYDELQAIPLGPSSPITFMSPPIPGLWWTWPTMSKNSLVQIRPSILPGGSWKPSAPVAQMWTRYTAYGCSGGIYPSINLSRFHQGQPSAQVTHDCPELSAQASRVATDMDCNPANEELHAHTTLLDLCCVKWMHLDESLRLQYAHSVRVSRSSSPWWVSWT